MTNVISYLTFNGNCREAMNFYQKCLGGELTFQTIGESPLAINMEPKMKDCILHASLQNGKFILMGSDMVGDQGLVRGNSVSLLLNCQSEAEIKSYYSSLSEGGIQTHPPEKTYWGALFGNLTDQYGNNWMLHFDFKHHSTL